MNEELIKQCAEEACGPEWYGPKPNLMRGGGDRALRLYHARAVAPLERENAELRALVAELTEQTKRDGERIGQLEAKVAPLVEAAERVCATWSFYGDTTLMAQLRAALAPLVQNARDMRATPAPQPSPDVAQWQPIETAPKDGTAILAILTGSELPHTIRWRGDAWTVAWDGHPLRNTMDAPTHWMPLPAPRAALAPFQQGAALSALAETDGKFIGEARDAAD